MQGGEGLEGKHEAANQPATHAHAHLAAAAPLPPWPAGRVAQPLLPPRPLLSLHPPPPAPRLPPQLPPPAGPVCCRAAPAAPHTPGPGWFPPAPAPAPPASSGACRGAGRRSGMGHLLLISQLRAMSCPTPLPPPTTAACAAIQQDSTPGSPARHQHRHHIIDGHGDQQHPGGPLGDPGEHVGRDHACSSGGRHG